MPIIHTYSSIIAIIVIIHFFWHITFLISPLAELFGGALKLRERSRRVKSSFEGRIASALPPFIAEAAELALPFSEPEASRIHFAFKLRWWRFGLLGCPKLKLEKKKIFYLGREYLFFSKISNFLLFTVSESAVEIRNAEEFSAALEVSELKSGAESDVVGFLLSLSAVFGEAIALVDVVREQFEWAPSSK